MDGGNLVKSMLQRTRSQQRRKAKKAASIESQFLSGVAERTEKTGKKFVGAGFGAKRLGHNVPTILES